MFLISKLVSEFVQERTKEQPLPHLYSRGSWSSGYAVAQSGKCKIFCIQQWYGGSLTAAMPAIPLEQECSTPPKLLPVKSVPCRWACRHMGIDCKGTMHYRLSATQASQRLWAQLLTMASWMQMCSSSSYPWLGYQKELTAIGLACGPQSYKPPTGLTNQALFIILPHQHSQQTSIKNRSTEYTIITLCLGTWEFTKIIDLQSYSTFDYPNLVSRISPGNLDQSAIPALAHNRWHYS